jgi:hypothetical protein
VTACQLHPDVELCEKDVCHACDPACDHRPRFGASAQPAPQDEVVGRTVIKIDGSVRAVSLAGKEIFRSPKSVAVLEIVIEQLPPVSRYSMTWVEEEQQ